MIVIRLPILALLVMLWQMPTVMAVGANITGDGSAGQGRLGFGFAPGLVAGRDYVAGQLIVGLDPSAPAESARAVVGVAARFGAKPGGEIPASAVLLEFSSEQAALQAVEPLLAVPGVSFIERNGRMGIPPMPEKPGRNGPLRAGSDTGGANTEGWAGWGWGIFAIVSALVAIALSRRGGGRSRDKDHSAPGREGTNRS